MLAFKRTYISRYIRMDFVIFPSEKLNSFSFLSSGPCAPVNVSASLVCENNTAAVSWQPSLGALSYKVTALGRNGDIKQCNTSNTSCYLPNLVCSQTYVIIVSPYSFSCKGIDSYPYNYIAGKNDNNNSLSHFHFVINYNIVVINFIYFDSFSV